MEEVNEAPRTNRYVQIRCPECDVTSIVCDQESDTRRELMWGWWTSHKQMRHAPPTPIIERAPDPTLGHVPSRRPGH